MTKLATMGTSSCATIALQGFKDEDLALNKNYEEGKDFECPPNDVDWFYNKILYPTRQDLGRTDTMPFELLMKQLDASRMKDKFIIATLNAYQFNQHNGYWPQRLEKWGFKLIDKTKNNIGSVNYIFTRNIARVD